MGSSDRVGSGRASFRLQTFETSSPWMAVFQEACAPSAAARSSPRSPPLPCPPPRPPPAHNKQKPPNKPTQKEPISGRKHNTAVSRVKTFWSAKRTGNRASSFCKSRTRSRINHTKTTKTELETMKKRKTENEKTKLKAKNEPTFYTLRHQGKK